MRVFYSDHHEVALPPGHRFPMAKYRMLREALLARRILAPAQLLPAPLATRQQLALAHDEDYIDAFFAGGLDPRASRRVGLPWSEAYVARESSATGGTLHAAYAALEDGLSGNLAGGTHHAHRGQGEGFCTFNDVAVAALNLLDEERVSRIAVVDLDVHQGNGTASILGSHPQVFTLSIHGERNYPFHKVSSTLDVGLPDGTHDEAYREALAPALDAVWAFRPDFCFYLAGVDLLAEDALGRFAMTHEGLRQRDAMVLGGCRERGIPVAMCLGGGYARPIEASVEAYLNTYLEARRVYARLW